MDDSGGSEVDFSSRKSSEDRIDVVRVSAKGEIAGTEESAENALAAEKINVQALLMEDTPSVEFEFESLAEEHLGQPNFFMDGAVAANFGDMTNAVDFVMCTAGMDSYGIFTDDHVLLGSERIKAAAAMDDEPNAKFVFGNSIEESLRKVSLEGISDSSSIDCWFTDGDPSMPDFNPSLPDFNAGKASEEEKADGIHSTAEEVSVEKLLTEETVEKEPPADAVNDPNDDDDGDDDDDGSESSEESSSSSLSSSSSSSTSDEDDDLTTRRVIGMKKDDDVDKKIEVEDGEIVTLETENNEDVDVDDEENGGAKHGIRSKNELQELPLVPPVMVTLQPHHRTVPVGTILSIIGSKVVVEGAEKHNPLNEGSILWIDETRSALGIVDEIFGPVKNPYYVVRYNSEDEVPPGIEQGTTLVSFVEEFVSHVLNDKNLYKKGYDASGDNDEELSDEAEFSDDEKEAEYRKAQKTKKRGGGAGADPESKTGTRRIERRQPKNPNWNRSQTQPQPLVAAPSSSVQDPPPFMSTMWNNAAAGFLPQQFPNVGFPGGLLAAAGGFLPQNQLNPQFFGPGLQTGLMQQQQHQPIGMMPAMPLNFNMGMMNMPPPPQIPMGGSATGRGRGRMAHHRGGGRGRFNGRHQFQR